MYAKVTNLRFPPGMRREVVGVAQGLAPVLRKQRGFNGFQALTNPEAGEVILVSWWETEADAKVSEASSSYIGQMSMMSSFLYEPLAPKTYEISVRA
jgi:heme-degrading monooxygenase HmoA